MALTPEVAYYLGLGSLQVLLALVLLGLRFLDRANRALALLLILRGGFHLANWGSVGLDQEPRLGMVAAHLFVAYLLSIPYFVAVYPRPRPWLPRGPWGAAPFLGAMAAASLLLGARVLPDESGFPAWFDPLTSLLEVAFPLAALALARDALALGPGPRRSSLLLIAGAFTLIDFYDNVFSLGLDLRFGAADWLVTGVSVVNTALFAALAALLLRAERRAAVDPSLRRGLRRFLAAMGLAAASALAVAPLASPGGDGPGAALEAVWDLALPLLLAYALLRLELFGIDLKVKWTIRQSTIAGAFIGVFFVVSEGASNFFVNDAGFGPYAGIAAAGVLVFALAPLQRAAERVSEAALPGVRAPRDMSADERRRVYRQQAALAWADGQLSLDERQLLDGLRDHLGLGAEEAARLEREVTSGLRARDA